MLGRVLKLKWSRHYSSTSEIPSPFSFLEPSVFSWTEKTTGVSHEEQTSRRQCLCPDELRSLELTLESSLVDKNTDEAWKSFKALTRCSSFPSKLLIKHLITHLSSHREPHNLKRAFASVVFLVEKNSELLDFDMVVTFLNAIKTTNTATPAFAVIRSLLKNRYFMPFHLWGGLLVEISRTSGSFVPFLQIFKELCLIVLNENLDSMKPDIEACNAALQACCCELESVSESDTTLQFMAALNVRPNEETLGLLAYLYALRGLEGKIMELEYLMNELGFHEKSGFIQNLVLGYVKSGNITCLSGRILKGASEERFHLSEDTYSSLVKGFLQYGTTKDLAALIIESQNLRIPTSGSRNTVSYGIMNACIGLHLLDKARDILDEVNASGNSAGIGAYLPILKAFTEDRRTGEATQLVMEFRSSGTEMNEKGYDELIDACMSCHDFTSAFTLFRSMRDSRLHGLTASYMTIMTGLTEHHRPELMAAFLDDVVDDPRVEIGTHDWNSIIHGFCKAGRLEDAVRTFRRMSFLRFEPNEQTYLSLIHGYAGHGKYFNVLILWNELKKKLVRTEREEAGVITLNQALVDAFIHSLVKGGFFDAVMQVVNISIETRVFVDKWRYKQAFMETHKKLRGSKLRKRNSRKYEAVIAFKNWVGLSI